MINHVEVISVPYINEDFSIGAKHIQIHWIKPVLLEEVIKDSFYNKPGVYFLHRTTELNSNYNDMLNSEDTFYIGMANRETIRSRVNKHYLSITDARTKSGNPVTRPGINLKRFRESIEFNPSNIYVLCAIVPDNNISVILEPLFVHAYKQIHGRMPAGNTQDF